jgi:hypothetical protein
VFLLWITPRNVALDIALLGFRGTAEHSLCVLAFVSQHP